VLSNRSDFEGGAEHAPLGCDRSGARHVAADEPWHRLYTETKQRHGKSNPAKAAVAREVLIASWHVLARNEPFKRSASSATNDVSASSSIRLGRLKAHERSEKRGSCNQTRCAPSAERDLSTPSPTTGRRDHKRDRRH
jgi:hypothetical protein